ncbi:MAG: LPXTG cell wall anchor domain-containing protein, partial [Motilibacteraceae bacterium]
VNGELVPGSFRLPTAPEGITYSSDGNLVIATADEGYVLGSAEGWTGDSQRQTFTLTYGGPTTCPTPPQTVTPGAPSLVQPGCDGTTLYPGSITPVTTTGITYSVSGTTVTATAQEGFVLGEAKGWNGNDNVQTYVVTFNPAPTCGTTPPPPPVVINPSDLSLVKTVDKAQAKPGDVLTYSLTATVEIGAKEGVEAQNAVTIEDVVPAGTTYVADSAECTTTTAPEREVRCTPLYNPATRTVSAKADGLLAVGDSLELSFQTRIASPAVVDGKALTQVDNTGLVQSGAVEGVESNTVSTSITDVEGVIIEKPPVQKPPVQQPGAQAPGTVEQPATLPHTGAAGSRLPLTGLLLLGLGLALVLAGRRRREHAA